MKKLLSIIFSAILCVSLFAFVGCTDNSADKKACEGIYYFHDGTGTLHYNNCLFTWYNEGSDNPYPNVVGGFADFNKFYIELNDGKMTVHGSLTHKVIEDDPFDHPVKIIANPDVVEEYEYTLVKREGKYGYSIYVDGEDTGYIVAPPNGYPADDYDGGHISYSFGTQDTLHVILNWTKTKIEFPQR